MYRQHGGYEAIKKCSRNRGRCDQRRQEVGVEEPRWFPDRNEVGFVRKIHQRRNYGLQCGWSRPGTFRIVTSWADPHLLIDADRRAPQFKAKLHLRGECKYLIDIMDRALDERGQPDTG